MTEDKPYELQIVGRRCVYLNGYRIAGAKPYMSEDLPRWSFRVSDKDLASAVRSLGTGTNRLLGAQEWRPIETAPKDGSDVLTWDGNDCCVLFFSQHGHGWTAGNPKVKYQPTHWMPLPLTPTPDPAGGMPVEVK